MSSTRSCPECKGLVDEVEHRRFLPFCSERCRLIDLSKWLDEEYRIPAIPLNSTQVEKETFERLK